MRSEICHARGDARESAWHLRNAIEIHPHYPEAHYRLGIYWLALGHRDLANSYFRRAAELTFGDILLHHGNRSASNGILIAGKPPTEVQPSIPGMSQNRVSRLRRLKHVRNRIWRGRNGI